MKVLSRWPVFLAFTMLLAGVQLILAVNSHAQSSYFTSRGCVDCHSAPVVASCNGCHYHGNRSLQATTNKTSYTPGETVSVTLTSASTRSGWIKAILYNQSNAVVAASSGNASGMGGSTTFPATLSAPAPPTPGTYTWQMAYLGNDNGIGWDVHSEAAVSTNTFTVAAAADTAAPTVSAFTLPVTSTSLTVPVSSFTASDNVGVTGYLVTTSATAPAASAAGWSAAAPASVTAPAAGTVTFYAWAKDAAGNISASRSATVTISTEPAPDVTKPALTVSTQDNGAITSNPTLNVSGNATDDVALQSVSVNGSSVQADASGNFSTAVVLVEGPNVITVVATDTAGNSTTNVRTITYVTNVPVPSELVITAPVDNLVSAQQILVVQGTTGELAMVTASVNGGSPQVAALSGNTFTVSVYLEPGLNTIVIQSVAPDNSSSSAKRTVIYDNTKPTVAVTEPDEDKIVSDPSLMIKGKVADSLSKVTVKLTMGGQVYYPVVREGKFEQKVKFGKPQQYTVVVTATDEAGNVASATRNIIYRKGKGNGRDD